MHFWTAWFCNRPSWGTKLQGSSRVITRLYVNVQYIPINEMGGFRLIDLRLSIRWEDICQRVIWRDRFNQSELGKSCYNASYTFRRGESCNRLNVFPQIVCFYNPSRSFPGWACPHLASCPSFDPFLPFSPEISLFQGNGWVRVSNSFSEAKFGDSVSLRVAGFRHS